jgi:hypothetical protein
MNGHDHGEHIEKIGKTYYYALNSMSYIWVGPQYEHFTYSKETHVKYPYLKDLVLYEEGLFAIVKIDENGDNFYIDISLLGNKYVSVWVDDYGKAKPSHSSFAYRPYGIGINSNELYDIIVDKDEYKKGD